MEAAIKTINLTAQVAEPVVMIPDPAPMAPESKPLRKVPHSVFKVGHPRYGGRKKGSPVKRTAEAREIAEKLGFHPVEFLARVATEGVMLNPDGSKTVCDNAMRLDAAKAVSKFLVPTLAATQVTGKNDGPVENVTFDMNKFLESPAAVEAAQKLSLAISNEPDDSPLEISPENPSESDAD